MALGPCVCYLWLREKNWDSFINEPMPNGGTDMQMITAPCWSLGYRNKEEECVGKPQGRKIFLSRFACNIKFAG